MVHPICLTAGRHEFALRCGIVRRSAESYPVLLNAGARKWGAEVVTRWWCTLSARCTLATHEAHTEVGWRGP